MNRTYALLALGAMIVGGFLFGARSIFSVASSESPAAHVSISLSSIDFGDIDQNGGIVSKDIAVTNDGNQSLTINRISTSCGCTTAQMDTSPLEAGETRTLTIRFDPMAHPDQSGPITRAVYLQTSDPKQPEVEINIVGNVMKDKSTVRI